MTLSHRFGLSGSLLLVIGLASACAASSSTGEASDEATGAATAASQGSSPWGYASTVPFNQLATSVKDGLRKDLPLDGVGAIVTTRPPYRATAMYLGSFHGLRLFGIAAHVASRGVESVVFGQLSGKSITVKVDPTPIFSSMPRGDSALHSDIAVLRASGDVDSATSRALDALPVTTWSFAPVASLLAEIKADSDPSAGFYFVGRASIAATMKKIDSVPNAWGETTIRAWKLPGTQAEADQNLDHNADGKPPVGDVFVISKFDVQANGRTQPLFDPDGLTLAGASDPFLAADSGWKVVSIAGNYLGVGRTSGSPVFAKTSRGVVVVGVNWTSGVSEDTTVMTPKPLTDPKRAFGDVREESVDGGLQLKLHQTAPFSYAATTESAEADLAATIASATDPTTKYALEELLAKCAR